MNPEITVDAVTSDGEALQITLLQTGEDCAHLEINSQDGGTEEYDLTDVVVSKDNTIITANGPYVLYSPVDIVFRFGPNYVDMTVAHSIFDDGETVFEVGTADLSRIRGWLRQCTFPNS
jgi:hypothetical protein